MTRTLREKIPDAEFVILSTNPELDSKRYDAKVLKGVSTNSLRLNIFRYFIWIVLSLFKIRADFLVKFNERETLHAFSEADIILVDGGDILRELSRTPWERRYLGCLYFVFLSKILRKPVVIYAHTIGPFRGRWSNVLSGYILNMTELLMVRDEFSKKYLSKLNITKPQIHLTADPAFLLETAPKERGMEILSIEGIDPDERPLIGVQIASTVAIYGFSDIERPEEKREKYAEVMTKLIDSLTEELNSVVVLLPHQFGPGKKNDDRVLSRALHERVINKEKVKLINEEYAPEELRRIIGQFDLLISNRMHPIIHAISMNVPVVGVDYDHKIGALMEMLNQVKYLSHLRKLDLDRLKTKIFTAYFAKDTIKEELKVSVGILKERARLNSSLVKTLINRAEICRPLSPIATIKSFFLVLLTRAFH